MGYFEGPSQEMKAKRAKSAGAHFWRAKLNVFDFGVIEGSFGKVDAIQLVGVRNGIVGARYAFFGD